MTLHPWQVALLMLRGAAGTALAQLCSFQGYRRRKFSNMHKNRYWKRWFNNIDVNLMGDFALNARSDLLFQRAVRPAVFRAGALKQV